MTTPPAFFRAHIASANPHVVAIVTEADPRIDELRSSKQYAGNVGSIRWGIDTIGTTPLALLEVSLTAPMSLVLAYEIAIRHQSDQLALLAITDRALAYLIDERDTPFAEHFSDIAFLALGNHEFANLRDALQELTFE